MPATKIRRPWLDYLVYLVVRSPGRIRPDALDRAVVRAGEIPGLGHLSVDSRHRKVGLENLAMAFGDRFTEAERDQIIRGVYSPLLQDADGDPAHPAEAPS